MLSASLKNFENLKNTKDFNKEESGYKKRKNSNIICTITDKITKNTQKISKQDKNAICKYAKDSKLIIYIKTLLEAYKFIPSIIKKIDEIIEKRASSVVTTSYIYSSPTSTYDDINKVIDLTERKDKMINLYVLINDMLTSLSDEQKNIAVMKYIKNNKCDEIAEVLNTSERTIYRKCNKIIENLCIYCTQNNINNCFFKSQLSNEPWLKSIYYKKLQEEGIN